jgi:hypothetical protein
LGCHAAPRPATRVSTMVVEPGSSVTRQHPHWPGKWMATAWRAAASTGIVDTTRSLEPSLHHERGCIHQRSCASHYGAHDPWMKRWEDPCAHRRVRVVDAGDPAVIARRHHSDSLLTTRLGPGRCTGTPSLDSTRRNRRRCLMTSPTRSSVRRYADVNREFREIITLNSRPGRATPGVASGAECGHIHYEPRDRLEGPQGG